MVDKKLVWNMSTTPFLSAILVAWWSPMVDYEFMTYTCFEGSYFFMVNLWKMCFLHWRRHKFVIRFIMDVMAELAKTHTDFHLMAWVSVWDIDDGGSFLPDVEAHSLFEWILSWDRWAWMCGLQTFFLHHGSHFLCRAFCDGGWWKLLVFTSKM